MKLKTDVELSDVIIELIEQNKANQPDAVCALIAPRLIHADIKRKECCLAYDPAPWMRNPRGLLHGGIIATMLDNAAGTLCRCFEEGEFHPTVYMQINYIRAIQVDAPVYIQARITASTRSFIHMSVEAWAESRDKLAATCSLSYFRNVAFV